MPMLSKEEAAALMAECRRTAKKLWEMGAHGVLILYTEPSGGQYTMTWAREGSPYECLEMCRRYISIREQENLAQEIAAALPKEPPDDDTETWGKPA
jgi:hypothetical protein